MVVGDGWSSGVGAGGRSTLAVQGAAPAATRAGTVAMVSSSGTTSSSSSQVMGVDTCAPTLGRTLHAPNTVLCGAFWLKSTKRSEEHTSELQSLMRISYAVFCLKKKKTTHYKIINK